MTVLALLLAAAAAAQSPMPVAPQEAQTQAPPPAASTATVAASTATAEVAVSTGGVKVAGEAKPKLSRPIHATLHAEAKDWEPLSLKPGGDPLALSTSVEVRLEKVKGKYKGAASKATASARVHKERDARWLVVSLFPKRLGGLIDRDKPHFEIRYRIVEGFVEDVKAVLVRLDEPRAAGAAGLDAWELRERGISYEEDTPGSGAVLVAALDPRPSKTARNAGKLERAAFASADVRLATLTWSVVGLK